jgi:hypothetical protein
VTIGLAVIAGDMAFATADVIAFAGDSRSTVLLLPQAIFVTPQALLFNSSPYTDPEMPVGIAMFGDQMATFAIYGMASSRVSTTVLYPLSWAIGANVALTNNALALAFQSKLSPKAVATTEIVASVPQLIVAGFALGSPDNFSSQRSALFALGGWSAGLFTHGVMSLMFRYAAHEPEPEPKRPQAEWKLTPGLVSTSAERSVAPGFLVHGRF